MLFKGHSNVPWLYHVLRAEHHEAVYHINRKSNRHSVVVPLHTPTLGSEFVTIMYKFTCKTSCAFGLNRRPVHVVFTLETAQYVTFICDSYTIFSASNNFFNLYF